MTFVSDQVPLPKRHNDVSYPSHVRFARRGMLDATRQGFHAMNIALKERAENQTA